MMKQLLGAVLGLAILGGLGLYSWAVSNNKIVFGYNLGYQPTQPIPFSHEKHAGELKMDCRYCHSNVAVSRHASVPSLNICMNCHLVVKAGSPHIQKLAAAYNSGESIKWEKVHLLPDHVKFNHSAHIRAGQECQTCHGPIEKMEEVYQYSSLSMGWCVSCHRQPKARDVASEDIQAPMSHEQYQYKGQAPQSCGTCHY